jgi:hypothetical protein
LCIFIVASSKKKQKMLHQRVEDDAKKQKVQHIAAGAEHSLHHVMNHRLQPILTLYFPMVVQTILVSYCSSVSEQCIPIVISRSNPHWRDWNTPGFFIHAMTAIHATLPDAVVHIVCAHVVMPKFLVGHLSVRNPELSVDLLESMMLRQSFCLGRYLHPLDFKPCQRMALVIDTAAIQIFIGNSAANRLMWEMFLKYASSLGICICFLQASSDLDYTALRVLTI